MTRQADAAPGMSSPPRRPYSREARWYAPQSPTDPLQLTAPLTGVHMQVFLNGEPRRLDASITVAELIHELAHGARRIAVERNGAIVPRSQHATTRLAEGDRIEVVV